MQLEIKTHLSQDEIDAIIYYWNIGYTIGGIAKTLNHDRDTIKRILRAYLPGFSD